MDNKINNKPIVWTISGSDCSGGAGIAADIKTGHSLGVEVCHLITANTVQNSQQLISVNPISVGILQQQFDALITDKPPRVIKIGLLANSEQVAWLVNVLTTLKSESPHVKVIFDPVGQASVGGKFSQLSVAELTPLLVLVDIITPNSMEAKILADSNADNVERLAESILALGVNSVIIKGGHPLIPEHMAGDNHKATQGDEQAQIVECVDYCLHTLTDDDSSKMSEDETIAYGLCSPVVNTNYTHGGGCSFASALAAFVAQGHLTRDAFTLAKAFINQGLVVNENKQDHYGAFEQTSIPKKSVYFPTVSSSINTQYQALTAFKSLALNKTSDESGVEKLGLYPVIDSLYWLERLLPLGLNIIQLRVKNKSQDELNHIIKQAVSLSKQYPETRLFINDYWQLAIEHGAYGVHIGQEDLQTTPIDKIHAAGLRLGISTHGCYEFLLAQQLQPSYLAIGAIYPTKTKNMTGQIQGVDNLAHILNLATNIPVVAIGGINHSRAPEVLATGVDSIAVVTAITEAESPERAVSEFQQLING